MKHKEEIEFVARHYQRGLFNTRAALMRMGIRTGRRWSTWRIAASIAVVLAISVASALIIHRNITVGEQQPETSIAQTSPEVTVKVLDFEAAALPTVISEIQTTFGVKIGGAPSNAADLKLTLHYEGDIETLITTINEILGTELYVMNSEARKP